MAKAQVSSKANATLKGVREEVEEEEVVVVVCVCVDSVYGGDGARDTAERTTTWQRVRVTGWGAQLRSHGNRHHATYGR